MLLIGLLMLHFWTNIFGRPKIRTASFFPICINASELRCIYVSQHLR